MRNIEKVAVCLLISTVFMMPISAMRYEISSSDYTDTIGLKHTALTYKDSQSELKWMIAGDSIRCLHSYWLHVPPSYDGLEAIPLVMVLQGSYPFNWNDPFGSFRQSISVVENQTKFSEKADEEEFIVVYPNAKLFFHHIESGDVTKFDYNYDWTPPLELGYIDDIGFIRALIDKMKQEYTVDSNRIYVTGFSAGALMTYSIGAHLSDDVAAIASVAGAIGGRLDENNQFSYIPTPENPVSVITLHGTNDRGLPYEESEHYVSVNESISFWVEHNGCDSIPETNMSESGMTIRRTYANGNDETEVILYTLIGLDHRWPVVRYNCEILATEVIWDFFESHPKQ